MNDCERYEDFKREKKGTFTGEKAALPWKGCLQEEALGVRTGEKVTRRCCWLLKR